MPASILATKLYLPPLRPNAVLRPRLTRRLDQGLERKLSLISAAAGFGKTTLVSEWAAGCQRLEPGVRVAWLSLDEGDSDPARFLAYLIAALQTIEASIGAGVLGALQAPQPPPIEVMLTALLNEIAAIPDHFILILDDYHNIDASAIDQALTFLIERLPVQMHLVIATREDPNLPLARLRARGQMTELRAADLRFTPSEAADFLNQVMGLNLAKGDIAALEARTEGWIAGLQLAALALQGLAQQGAAAEQGTISTQRPEDATSFIQSFTGSHRFVLDYLVEEVLQQQSESVQTFLLRTSILERMCGPLCEAVLGDQSGTGQETLAYLERANLFIIPLDNQRRWYRYHHLFGDLLRQRLSQNSPPLSFPPRGGTEGGSVAELHLRASEWYENNGLEIEAFQHAAAAHDIDRAARLVEGEGMPLLFRGAVAPVLHWLESLPKAALDARPALWVIYASALLFVGQIVGIEGKVQAAEAALEGAEPDDRNRDLIGHIASIRATLAVTQHQAETILAQSRRALEYLRPDNLAVRTATTWTLGHAHHLQGDRAAARQCYTEALAASQAIGHFIITIMATLGLGNLQETNNQLDLAAETYRGVLQLAGDPPLPIACEAHLGLARICYERNDLDAAEHHGQQSLRLAQQIENTDRSIACEVFLARLKLARGQVAQAAASLAEAGQSASQYHFTLQMPEVAAAQALTRLRQGNPAAAASLVEKHGLPLSQARVHLAQGDPGAALALLDPLRQQAQAKEWPDETLKAMVLQAVALQAKGQEEAAVELLGEALRLAEPGGLVRTFLDEGAPMAELLSAAAARRISPDYVRKLLAAFEAGAEKGTDQSSLPPPYPARQLIEPLSQRELEVLQLIAEGLSNREIGERLFLAQDTVKGHNRRIFDKLQVQRRTEAVARARKLGLL